MGGWVKGWVGAGVGLEAFDGRAHHLFELPPLWLSIGHSFNLVGRLQLHSQFGPLIPTNHDKSEAECECNLEPVSILSLVRCLRTSV